MVKWLPKELQAWKPPERLTVSEWADNNRIIEAKTSITSANLQWKTDFTPYLREIMDTYNEPYIEEVAFCKPTQVGGTETGFNILGYIIDQEPASILVVYPAENLADYTSDNRIKPMLRLCPTLAEKWQEKDSKKLELQFPGMYISLVGANSPGQLASKPIGKIIFDETDKYPPFSGTESDPISLGTERSKNFRNRKIYKWSTPTIESGPIWSAFLASDVKKQFFVPCPHCGHYQTFKLKQIKWPRELNEIKDYIERARQVEELAWYECEECHGVIVDKHKSAMLKSGQWRPIDIDKESKFYPADMPKGRIKKVGYHLNSIYSPMVEFGKVAAEFIRSKDFPNKLMNFVNSWLGEPWRNKTNVFASDEILKKQHGFERLIVPFDAGTCLLTGGVDVQKDHFWYVTTAWGAGFTGKVIDYGRLETWDDLIEMYIHRFYINEKGQKFRASQVFIDSGYNTDHIYDFCAMYREVFMPSKGANRRLNAPLSISTIERRKDGKQWISGLKLYEVDTEYFKDFIFGRLEKDPADFGSWSIFKGEPQELRELADHLCSEKKDDILDRKTGKITQKWGLISSHAENHLLDCAVYSAAAAENCGVRYLQKAIENAKNAPKRQYGVVNKGL